MSRVTVILTPEMMHTSSIDASLFKVPLTEQISLMCQRILHRSSSDRVFVQYAKRYAIRKKGHN